MKVLIDTNVIVDFLLRREPFFQDAVFVFDLIEKREIQGFISAISVTTVDYIVCQAKSRELSYRFIHDLLEIFEVCEVGKETFLQALQQKGRDLEDNMIIANALAYHLDTIITRNKKDFKEAQLQILTPSEFIKDCFER